MDKVISEFKVVETEDGFHIEIKGDKEAIRRMLSGFGLFDWSRAGAPFGHGFRSGFGPGSWSGFADCCGSRKSADAKDNTV